MRFYAISGSLRATSVHSALLRAFKACAADGIEIDICGLLGELPIFNPDREGELTPPVVLEFAQKVGDCDGLIIASPEYAHGIPGGLKNAFDWLVSRFEIIDKPVMLVHGYQDGRGEFAQTALAEVLKTASLDIMPGRCFQAPLVGKAVEEAKALLDGSDIKAEMQRALADFQTWISRSRA